jgi:uncharacterized protein (DUF58 family)
VLTVFKSILAKVDRPAWARFFIAIGGLTLAFAAALYSTAARDAGNVLMTAVLASFALLTAGVVGILTVPYLARRVAAHRLRRRFQYEFTKEFAVYLFAVLVIVVAALNTGNNLLFIVVSAMLAAIAISGFASAGMLRALELDASLPMHIFAGNTVIARLMLTNRRWWAPALSVSVEPLKTRKPRVRYKWQRTIWGWPRRRPPEKQWLRLSDWEWKGVTEPPPPPGIFQGSVYFPMVRRNGTASAEVELTFRQRGLHAQKGLGIATRFPFAFFKKTRPMALSQEVVIYPSVEPTEDFFQVLPMITGEFEMFVRGRGNNLYLIREHTPQDSARHVDWKATAKTGALKVREFTREDERKLRIVFDNAEPGRVPEKEYENAVSLAASLAWYFAQSDAQLSFAGQGYNGSDDIYEFLRYLGMVQPGDRGKLLEELEVSDDYNIVITARKRGTISTRLWASSYFLFMQK